MDVSTPGVAAGLGVRWLGVRVIEEREGGIVRRIRLLDGDGAPVGVVCRFLEHLGDRGMSPNTLRAYGYDLRYLFTFLTR